MKSNLSWFIFFWIAFTSLNVYISYYKPIQQEKAAEAIVAKQNEPVHQSEPLYIHLLTRLQNDKCESVTDKENNTFYTCQDGTKVSMINWIRGERKGVVTREYEPSGKLIQIYGHPDDVY